MRYKILTFLFTCIAFSSCIDDLDTCVDENEIPAIFTDGYSLNLRVAVDDFGGEGEYGDNPMKELENYIDPEKFRVLFFDREDRFLFESKSRWVKQLAPNEKGGSEWFVSVPLYPYGNDENEDWNWEEIRRVLTGEDSKDSINGKPIYKVDNDGNPLLPWAFKIAVLANRPNREWNMGIYGRGEDKKTDIPDEPLTPGGFSIQNGPHWTTENTRWGKNEKDRREVFDLHHCQYDPIYDGKNWDNTNPTGTETKDGKTIHTYEYLPIYDFIADTITVDGKVRPKLGAVSTWVDWGVADGQTKNDTRKDNVAGGEYRMFTPLEKTHPIPMYGIQSFDKIENWVKGTPFNVSQITEGQTQGDYNCKTIALLRSVVKLELVLPEEPEWVLMWYPNLYARCEPMDVWTPTDSIWKNNVHDATSWNYETDCEWQALRNYGPVATTAVSDNISKYESIKKYQEMMSWFYGIWKKYGKWDFNVSADGYYKGFKKEEVINEDKEKTPYPRIFNTCVQRNTTVSCKQVDYSDKFISIDNKYHYIVYTGERNVNDPSDLYNMGDIGGGKPTITYWMIKFKNKNNNDNYIYSIALTDHNTNASVKAYKKSTLNGKPSNTMGGDGSYERAVQKNDGSAVAPWPLLRNHVYRITISGQRAIGEEDGLAIKSEEFHSKSLLPSKSSR